MENNIERKYCNVVGIEASNYDINFSFGSRRSQNGPNIGVSQDEVVAEIVMSPQHAKVFAMTLMNTIKQFEEIFGEINIVADEKKAKIFARQEQK